MKSRKKLFEAYLQKLTQTIRSGDAREESLYPALADLIQEIARATGRPDIQVTIQPRPTEAGNPDFRVWDGVHRIVGYIEAKLPTEVFLDQVEHTEQLKRYRNTFPNLLLTNFLEFRLYRDGERVATVQIGRPSILTELHQTPPVEHVDDAWALLDQFLGFSLPAPPTAQKLAIELAKRTRYLKDVVLRQLREEEQRGTGSLLGFYEAFQKFLIGSLDVEEFADLYAQTITYGLFAARTRATNGFSRLSAFNYIPRTIGILRDLFRFISLGELPEAMAWVVDDIVQVLAVADVKDMMERYYREGKGADPVVHFYETFLAHYDPEERERRGVYYTPDPVVSYIVRSLHQLLKDTFGKADGLASEGVTLLDPAAGTMTFVARAAEQAVREFVDKYGTGGREAFIRNHILRNFYAFELMMAPYAVGHLKMAFFLEELGHHLADDERVPFYLTNALDMSELEESKLPGLSSLAEESHKALEVKGKVPILVILGNPPYSGHSANRGRWILDQIKTYKKVDGKPLGEKNPKWLQDDYVKFIRFAQWKIEQAGRGVVGFITNHSYLDNPTFRGMRRSLMNTFDEIYLLDLHGNALKRERCPDGRPDENVFDIRQGVAMAFFVKTGKPKDGEPRVFHADLWGRREEKYAWLEAHDIRTTPWTEIRPKPAFYLFVPRDEARLERYHTFPRITDIFQKYSVGIVTARDRLTIHWTPDDVWTTVLTFSRMDPELAREAYRLGKDARDWKVALAQQDLRESGPDRKHVVPILYRPFDVRYTYYTGRSRGFICMPRPEVMRHMLAGENVALCVGRAGKVVGSEQWNLAFCAQAVTDFNLFYRGGNITCPLYLYPDTGREGLFGGQEAGERRPNLNPDLLAALQKAYHPTPTHTPPPRSRGGGRGEGFPRERGGGRGEGFAWQTPPHLWEKLKPLAREMRKNPTPAENLLWQYLRNRQVFGYKFRRQHAVDRFIVDFYCGEARLIVEVDGPIHQYTPEEDRVRQEFLESLGYRVLRFTNEQVLTNVESVLNEIRRVLEESRRVREPVSPERVFHYIYAVLYAPTYRERYADFLRIDFPRIPFPADREVFEALAELGQRLVDLHLLRSPELDPPLTRFEGEGDNRVETGKTGLRYDPRTERVYINPTQYFAPVPMEIWEYTIGGYQVAHKWLKDRKNRKLTLDEIRTYCRIITALARTMELQKEIDELYPRLEENVLSLEEI